MCATRRPHRGLCGIRASVKWTLSGSRWIAQRKGERKLSCQDKVKGLQTVHFPQVLCSRFSCAFFFFFSFLCHVCLPFSLIWKIHFKKYFQRASWVLRSMAGLCYLWKQIVCCVHGGSPSAKARHAGGRWCLGSVADAPFIQCRDSLPWM